MGLGCFLGQGLCGGAASGCTYPEEGSCGHKDQRRFGHSHWSEALTSSHGQPSSSQQPEFTQDLLHSLPPHGCLSVRKLKLPTFIVLDFLILSQQEASTGLCTLIFLPFYPGSFISLRGNPDFKVFQICPQDASPFVLRQL